MLKFWKTEVNEVSCQESQGHFPKDKTYRSGPQTGRRAVGMKGDCRTGGAHGQTCDRAV